jgi:hypothetical protein
MQMGAMDGLQNVAPMRDGGPAQQSQKEATRICGIRKLYLCAILIELSDLIMAIGVGMTTKFSL